MTVKLLAKEVLGNVERWPEITKLNPMLTENSALTVGTTVTLPSDAATDEVEVTPLPTLRRPATSKPRTVLPLTGTFTLKRDDKGNLMLPAGVLSQLGKCSTVLVSPGTDRCLWLTNQSHLDRLSAKLDRSPARASDVSSFKRLYYAQTVKVPVAEGKVHVSGRLATFAGLSDDVVLVGIDDHFEVWDAARWKKYTVAKKAVTEKE
jgi:MraZ protein